MCVCVCVCLLVCESLCFFFLQGYEGSFLKLISSKPGKPPQPIAFVSFTSRSLAERALEELQVLYTVSAHKFEPKNFLYHVYIIAGFFEGYKIHEFC